MRRALAVALLACATSAWAQGGALTVATWNIAWLRSQPLDAATLEQCRAMPRDLRDKLDDLDARRYVCRGEADYAELRRIAERVDADVFAVQEVESVAALERVFPRREYAVYLADGPWIQRVGFAVRRRVEVLGFATYRPLGAPLGPRARHGADVTVRDAGGRPLRLLNVHLKSACHARVLTDASRSRRDRDDDRPACHILADQVAPLEDWIDARAREGVDFIVLGDFNRRFDARAERDSAARDPQGRQLALWPEIDDGDPPGARLVRLTAGREQARNCWAGDRGLEPAERAMFIDHILVSASLAPRVERDSFRQWPLVEGRIGKPERERLRALSDHCPVSVRLR